MLSIFRILLFALLAQWSAVAWALGITLDIEDINASVFSARKVRAEVTPDMNRLQARVGELRVQDRRWRNVRLECSELAWQAHEMRCLRGWLAAGQKIPLRFRYNSAEKLFELELAPRQNERWQLTARLAKSPTSLALQVENGLAKRLALFFPDGMPKPSAGNVSGTVLWQGNQAQADLRLDGVAFSDASGMHAGEKVAGRVQVQASHQSAQWQWKLALDWRQGEVFWQPLYFAKGGHQLAAQGTLDAHTLRVIEASLSLAEIGTAHLSGEWDRTAGKLAAFDLVGQDLKLAQLYAVLIKPFLEKTALGQAEASGLGDLSWRYRKGETEHFLLKLRQAGLKDAKQRFSLVGIDADVPWQRDTATQGEIRIASGSLYKLPFGAMRIPLGMHGWRFDIAQVNIPLLDGKLSVQDFHAEKGADGWQWQFGGGLTPISMQEFSAALGLKPMHGTLSGIIPRVSYAGQQLKVDGALLFKVFDGTAVVKGLNLFDPFGPAPRLAADIDMQRLDLALLTRTFSFGNMQGLIDVEVKDLQLSNWKPVSFDARVASSPGDYPRKISQKAVQNISALGGAGAAAAIQRSFLSFFEQFGYEKIGLSCRLRNGVCVMDGVTEAPQGYVIVQGGGIPAISVIGYNRYVSWQELLDRLNRITQTNVKPIVQ